MRFFIITTFLLFVVEREVEAQLNKHDVLSNLLPVFSIDYHYHINDNHWSSTALSKQKVSSAENQWELFFVFRWECDVQKTSANLSLAFNESFSELRQYTPETDIELLEPSFLKEKELHDDNEE